MRDLVTQFIENLGGVMRAFLILALIDERWNRDARARSHIGTRLEEEKQLGSCGTCLRRVEGFYTPDGGGLQ